MLDQSVIFADPGAFEPDRSDNSPFFRITKSHEYSYPVTLPRLSNMVHFIAISLSSHSFLVRPTIRLGAT